MITVAEGYDIQESQRLQMALDSEEIPSFIPDEFTAQNTPWNFIGTSSGVRLQVADEHAAKARQIIEQFRAHD